MVDGKISETGSYATLVENNGAFAEFLRTYASEREEEEDTGTAPYIHYIVHLFRATAFHTCLHVSCSEVVLALRTNAILGKFICKIHHGNRLMRDFVVREHVCSGPADGLLPGHALEGVWE